MLENEAVFIPLIIVIFLVFFTALWSFIAFITSRIGGWNAIAQHYQGELSYKNESLGFRSARFGWMGYSGVLTFSVNDEELGISVLFLYRVGHPPLKIPFEEINAYEKTVILPEVHMSFAQTPERVIKIPRRVADAIEAASGGNWTYTRKE
ncbi:MAG: hypothetical protein AB8G95_22360 [Anaerolineae bacterium]